MNKVISIGTNLKMDDGFAILKEIANASNDEKISTIVLLISSNGGNVEIITPIWEAIRACEKKVVAIGMNQVCSTAAAIFMMADERILFPNTEFLVHQSSYSFRKDTHFYARELKKIVKEIERVTELLLAPAKENSTIPEKVLKGKISNGDWKLTEEEMEKYRIITEKYDMKKVFEYLA